MPELRYIDNVVTFLCWQQAFSIADLELLCSGQTVIGYADNMALLGKLCLLMNATEPVKWLP